jgi:hypothetical protein
VIRVVLGGVWGYQLSSGGQRSWVGVPRVPEPVLAARVASPVCPIDFNTAPRRRGVIDVGGLGLQKVSISRLSLPSEVFANFPMRKIRFVARLDLVSSNQASDPEGRGPNLGRDELAT